MLKFNPIELSDKQLVNKYTRRNGSRICDLAFANLFVWQNRYKTSLCEYRDFLFIRELIHSMICYMLPLGDGDLASAIRLIEADAKSVGQPYKIHLMSRGMAERLSSAAPGKFEITPCRDLADYIHCASDLINLSGKKYHSKRNFITRFKSEYRGRYQYEDISAANMCDIFEFEKKWCRKNKCCSSVSLMEEASAIRFMLNNFETLDAKGGLLRVDGNVIAFTAGSELCCDTFDVSLEKADYDIVGSYQMINQAFAEHQLGKYTYINREDDMGIEGLRKAKSSYNPVCLEMKYAATPIR